MNSFVHGRVADRHRVSKSSLPRLVAKFERGREKSEKRSHDKLRWFMNVFRRTTGRERKAVSGYSRRINALAFSGRCTVTIMEKRIQEMRLHRVRSRW